MTTTLTRQLWPLAALCLAALACTGQATVDGPGQANPDTLTGGDGTGVTDDGADDALQDGGGTELDAEQDTGTVPDTPPAKDAQLEDAGGDTAGLDDTSKDDTGADVATPDGGDGQGDGGQADSQGDGGQTDGGPSIDKVTEHDSKCKVPSDCSIPCAKGLCVDGKCKYTPLSNACVVDIGGGKVACYADGMTNPKAPCLSCNTGVSDTALTSQAAALAVDAMEEGYKVADLTADGAGAMVWTISDKRAISGGKSLYFGDPKSKSYANDKHVKASVTAPPLSVPKLPGAKPTLAFWLWLQTEESKDYDVLTVAVKTAGGTKEVWSSDAIKGSTHGVWQRVEVDVSGWAGEDVQAVFTFDSKDEVFNTFEGAYVDAIAIQTGCCGSVADCDDGNACSTDTCAPNASGVPVCGHALKKDCCNSSLDCDDGKPCTLDLCDKPGGSCKNSDKPGCCLTQADCDDKDGCTIDHCPKAGAQCQHTNTCCKSDAECTSPDPCLKGTCTGGDCSFTSTCCSTDEECDDFNPCTKDACDNSKCVHTPSLVPGCCSPEPVSNDWENDMQGWKSDAANKGVTWHQFKMPAGSSAYSGSGVLRMGIKGKDTFTLPSSYTYVYAHSPLIKLPPNQDYVLEAKVKFDISYKSSSQYLYFYSWFGGKQYSMGTLYATKSGADKNGWFTFTREISSFAGKTFQIRLRGRMYGKSSGVKGKGILVDALKIKTSCNPKKCKTHSNCPTASYCLQGSCAGGKCLYLNKCCKTLADCGKENLCYPPYKCKYGYCYFQTNNNCCSDAGDCDDGNPCTIDSCPVAGKLCEHKAVPGCCIADSQCSDGDSCTADTCTGNKCTHKNNCCKTDSDCDDKDDKCTEDKCVAGKCNWKLLQKPGCCEPVPFKFDFNNGSNSGWSFKKCAASTAYYTPTACSNTSGNKPTKGWQVDPVAMQSKSPKGALYYGDPVAKNYNFGKSAGTAMSPKMKIPAGKSYVDFWIYWDTESGTTYDKSAVFLFIDGIKQNAGTTTKPNYGALWRKGMSGATKSKTWYHVKYDVSKWAGKSLQLQFYFNSGDSVSNSTQGVFVDDLKLLVDCAP